MLTACISHTCFWFSSHRRERKYSWKTKASISTRISRGKACLAELQGGTHTCTETSPTTGDAIVQPYSCREGFHTTLQQWISSGGVSRTVVSWQICPMGTWWTCSAPTAPWAPRFLLRWRESILSHHSPRTPPLLAPASSAPSPVPWSKPHKRLQDWLITQPAPHLLWPRNPRSS